MDFRILGALEVREAGRSLPLAGGRQRSLLAALLLRANEPVSVDRLMEDIWGEQPPEGGRKSVQVQISRLRKTLGSGEGRVLTRSGGYLIQVRPGELDLGRFERLVEEGRRALSAEDPERAAERLREGLELWRGAPLADLAFESFVQPEIGRLEELRLAALEDRIEADLARGHHADLVAEVEALVAEHPLRERLRRQLVVGSDQVGSLGEASCWGLVAEG